MGGSWGTNVGGADRVARLVVGLAIFSLLFVLDGNVRWWGLFGAVPLATAALRSLPTLPIARGERLSAR